MPYALRRRERADPEQPYRTGTVTRKQVTAQPGTLRAPGLLGFDETDVSYKVRIYEIAEPVVPNWFVVGYSTRIAQAGSVNIFFHPTPGQAGYNDGAYQAKTQKWPELIRYAHSFAGQTAAADRDVITIIPLLTQGAMGTCGIFPANWAQIVNDIIAGVAEEEGVARMSEGNFASLTVSSFSAGILYSDVFRRTAPGLAGKMTGVVDCDATFSNMPQVHNLSRTLIGRPGLQVVRYDQVGSLNSSVTLAPNTGIYHVPIVRWRNHAPRPTDPLTELHGLIPMRVWRHACETLNIG